MDITLYISRFLFRIRYQLIFGTLIVTSLVTYFTQFLAKTYTVTTSIYTGIASNTGLDEEDKQNWMEINNTFDNLVNLTQSKGTLEKVSLKLFALNMIYGDPDIDNTYIQAQNYRRLLKMVPEDVLKLIDKSSFEKTVNNLNQYKVDDPQNFLYELFNWDNSNYSYIALKDVVVRRIGNSDLIDISFRSSDPGIALNTVKLINDELLFSYEGLRYKAANDIVKYYEEQLKKLRGELNSIENTLTEYNVENGVINYGEQTKAIALAYTNYEDRYEQVLRDYESSLNLIADLEKHMETRSKLLIVNNDFINALNDISTINEKITEIEIFTTEDAQVTDKELQKHKDNLKIAEKKINELTNSINNYKSTKEGVALEEMVGEWLQQTIINTKTKAELRVLDDRKKTFAEQYKTFSPIGTQISRKEREIRVTEEAYLSTLRSLNLAKMKQKNIQLTSATLNTITEPAYPLMHDGSKRVALIIAAFLGAIIFIIGCNLIVELLDRTLRDAERTKRLTNTPVLGAFTGNTQLKYRGYIKACNRISAAYVCNRLNQYLNKERTVCINLLSIEDGEGKSFVSKYIIEQWEDQGLKVKYLVAGKDFQIDTSYILATGFEKFFTEKENFDILLLEHPSVQHNSLPSALLSQANANILIANACRVWKTSDDEFTKYLKDIAGTSPLFIYLNNANREAVEDFTGQLPPYSSARSLASKMVYMGLTAKESSVKQRPL